LPQLLALLEARYGLTPQAGHPPVTPDPDATETPDG